MENTEKKIELRNHFNSEFSADYKNALFLDRDGVIIKDVGYISNKKDVVLEPGIKDLLKFVYKLNVPVFIVTNQSGISRGYYSWNEFDSINERMINLIGAPSPLVAIYANSHSICSETNWRKPNPEMILAAKNEYNLNINGSILIGDRLSDMIAGCRGGIKTLIHVKTGHGRKEYENILNFCRGDSFFFDEKKSRIFFIENLLEFPYEIYY